MGKAMIEIIIGLGTTPSADTEALARLLRALKYH